VGHSRFGRARLRDVTKRVLDIAVAAVLLTVVAPLFLLIAVAVRLDSSGPVFFSQTRVGLHGKKFTMLKFRSMEDDAASAPHHCYVTMLAREGPGPADGRLLKLTDDDRVTRVGAVLRKTSLDELPQLLNVLAGQMSLVGPRPAMAYELELYRPEHFGRLSVRPGITGLWQVSGRSRLGFNEMLDLDLEYVRRRSFVFDLWLLARTPLAVLRAQTA
jgi:lipopolysaccharide/colanic/teichoic acid biosynthesis glycosyltransferase